MTPNVLLVTLLTIHERVYIVGLDALAGLRGRSALANLQIIIRIVFCGGMQRPLSPLCPADVVHCPYTVSAGSAGSADSVEQQRRSGSGTTAQ